MVTTTALLTPCSTTRPCISRHSKAHIRTSTRVPASLRDNERPTATQQKQVPVSGQSTQRGDLILHHIPLATSTAPRAVPKISTAPWNTRSTYLASNRNLQCAAAGNGVTPTPGEADKQPTIPLQQHLASALVGAAVTAGILLGLPNTHFALAATRLTTNELSTIKLFQRNTPGVVYITNLATRRDAFTMNVMEFPQGAGSGFVWDASGHIVTNYHVIRGASDVSVTFSKGNDYPAKVVGFDEDKDVAVLQIQSDSREVLQPLTLGTSSDLQVGQRVYAIGNPFGLDHTLTTGIISGTGREISSGNTGRPISDVIQTDAAINPGNSGGPLLDSSGSLIGINTAIYSPSGANTGVGFAIPVDIVKSSVDQIIKFGKVVRPIMGISFAPEQSVEQLGVSGVLVLDAKDGGPASKAGIKGTTRDDYGRLVLGDIILAINDTKVKNASDLYRVLDKSGVGETLNVEVLRGDNTVVLPIVLEASS